VIRQILATIALLVCSYIGGRALGKILWMLTTGRKPKSDGEE